MKHLKEFNNFLREEEEINTQPSIEEIDSTDLERLNVYDDNPDNPEKYKEYMKGVYDTPEEAAMDLARISYISNLLKGKIEYGEVFTIPYYHKIWSYLKRNIKGRRVYNGYPGGDGLAMVFSKVELPAAEEINPDEFEEEYQNSRIENR